MIYNEELYMQLFRRKSFHKFGQLFPMEESDLVAIQSAIDGLVPLMPDIRVRTRIVDESQTNCRRGAQKCVLFYSEEKYNSLVNVGYMGQQLDLKLVSMGYGTLWYGLGKTDEAEYDGLGFVIMIAVGKVAPDSFREDMYKAKRKTVSDIWEGPALPLADIVRFAPSACNSQPWLVKNTGDTLQVFRFRKKGMVGLIPMAFVSWYNRIDIGIFLLCLEVCMAHDCIPFERTVHIDNTNDDVALTLVAEYKLGI